MKKLLLIGLALWAGLAQARTLVVISIDGLDNRYLRDADKMGLKIPAIRKLMAGGAWAGGGVVGVMPSVTFPSHTTMVTGVPPYQHGIIANNDGNEVRFWYTRQIKVPILWDAAKAAGKTTGAVDWPVTVGAKIDYNFPEKFSGKDAGKMDMVAHEQVSTPGLIDKITAMYPSFRRPIVDDGARTQAVLYMMKQKADLVLVHLADHDSAAHDYGPYVAPSIATLERADECVGMIMAALPKDGVIALVSDHGFERVDRLVDPRAYSQGEMTVSAYIVTTKDAAVAAALRGKDGIGREIPQEELKLRSPGMAGMFAFAPVDHVNFGKGKLEKPKGTHGYWPVREDFRSVYVLWGAGVKKERLPEIEMTSIAGRLAGVLGVKFP